MGVVGVIKERAEMQGHIESRTSLPLIMVHPGTLEFNVAHSLKDLG